MLIYDINYFSFFQRDNFLKEAQDKRPPYPKNPPNETKLQRTSWMKVRLSLLSTKSLHIFASAIVL